jgi:hypothetical protein
VRGQRVKRERPRRSVTVITEAEPSRDTQRHRREIQYSLLMGLRVVALLLAAVLFSLHVPYLLLWILLCTVGMVVFPWMAVIIANDRPPKSSSRFSSLLTRRRGLPRGGSEKAADRALPSGERVWHTGE